MWSEAERIVRSTGTALLAWRDEGGGRGRWEGTQFKAAADRLAHEQLHRALSALTPGVAIVSEEDPASFASPLPHAYWILDPIDGTASFAEGYAGFVTQVAFVESAIVTWGAVYAPMLDALYVAARGAGATLNHSALSARRQVDRRILIDNYPEPRGFARKAYDGLHCTSYVECGSIGLKICRVADGTADLFVKDVSLRTWDVAAPALILAEAGGLATDGLGRPFAFADGTDVSGLLAAADDTLSDELIAWRRTTAASDGQEPDDRFSRVEGMRR
jgi:3'(2'), 5'-bisphosphate nucleotidase/myo-inositol-1(or 4)-monophosphatase